MFIHSLDGVAHISYETVECWNCKGKGTHMTGNWCPNVNKTVNIYPKKMCPHPGCNAKNKRDHKIVSESEKKCSYCEDGKCLENAYDSLPINIFQSIPMEVVRNNKERTFNQEYLGIGYVGGATDYGRMSAIQDNKEIIRLCREEYSSRQVIGFLKDKNENILCKSLMVVLQPEGYSILPIF